MICNIIPSHPTTADNAHSHECNHSADYARVGPLVPVDGHLEILTGSAPTLTFRGDAEFDLAMEAFEFLAEKLSTVRELSSEDCTPEHPEFDMSDLGNLGGNPPDQGE